MNIVFYSLINADYAVGLLALLKSLRISNPDVMIPYVVQSATPLPVQMCAEMLEIYRNIEFRLINPSPYEHCKFSKHRDWQMNPAYRYEIFRDIEFDQIIYLDADLLIVQDISELISFRGALGACPLPPGEGMELRNIGGFNCGVLSIGREARGPEIWKRLIEVATARSWSGNQTVLNIVLRGFYRALPTRYNVSSTKMTSEKLQTAAIIHYVGKYKPWQSEQQFGEYQLKMAGKDMCDQLSELWHTYANAEI